MPESNSAAVHIGLVTIQSQDFLNGEVLRGKRLVHFEAIHLLERKPRQLQRLLRRWHRTDSHNFRFYSGVGPTYYAADGFEIF